MEPEQIVTERAGGGQAMRYRVYSGPRGSAAIAALDKQQMLFKECDSLDAAIGWARHLAATGRVPLLIEGDDGTRLNKQDIAAAFPHAEHPAFAHGAAASDTKTTTKHG
jgi:hypothetical protein